VYLLSPFSRRKAHISFKRPSSFAIPLVRLVARFDADGDGVVTALFTGALGGTTRVSDEHTSRGRSAIRPINATPILYVAGVGTFHWE